MKVKVDNLIFIGIILHVLSTQSVLMYLFFDLFGVWEVKTFVHPVTFLLILLGFSLKINRLKLNIIDLITISYSLVLLVLLFFNTGSILSFYLAVREYFFLYILVYLFSYYSFSKRNYSILSHLLLILVFINLFLTILNNVIGGEAFMTMLVGYYKWDVDPETQFQISYYLGSYFRSPAAVGSSAAVAYFTVIAYFIFDLMPKQKFRKFMAILLLLSTVTRSAILCLVVYEFLKFISQKKNIALILKYGDIILGIIIISIVIVGQTSILSTKSLWIRFDVWLNEISIDYNLLFGGNMGQVGGAVRGSGHKSILDSYWLYLLYSSGLAGVFMWFMFFLSKAKVSKRKVFFVIGIVFSGLLVHLTQAIPVLVMLPLVFANYSALKE